MDKLALDKATKADIFERRIMRRFLREERGAAAPVRPQFVVLGGQPGSGKTGVLQTTQRELAQSGATWTINADDFAVHFPRYKQLQKRHGADAADMVRDVTGDWIKRTIAAAQQRGVNVVFESTMRQTDAVKQTLDDFRVRGYETHAKALAVSPLVSWQGNHTRREALAAEGAPSRLASREAHDAGGTGCRETLAKIERESLADRVTVVTRTGDVLYSNERHAGKWMKPAQAAESLQAFRDKPLTGDQAQQHFAKWGEVLRMAERRHARESTPAHVAQQERDAIRTSRATDAAVMRLRAADSEQRVAVAQGWDYIVDRAQARDAPAAEVDAARTAQARAHYALQGDRDAVAQYSAGGGDAAQSRALAAEHGKRMADALVNRPPEQAIHAYPELAPAYCHVAAAGAFALDRLPMKDHDAFVAKATARIADELARGKTIVPPTLERPRDIGCGR